MTFHLLKNFVSRVLSQDGSVSVDDSNAIKSFTDNPDFPYLVSFSRTGSHWLRMVMELYFEKPSLVRAFYFKNASDFTCYHTHDMDLKLRRDNVLYLYRDPVETIYSQLCYYKEDLDDQERRQYWTDLYAHHLSKWLVHDDFTKKKTVLTYEGMKSDMYREIAKICQHFDKEFNSEKLNAVLMKISKNALKKKTKHDQQVVNLTEVYSNERENFRDKNGKLIFDDLFMIEPSLAKFFNRANSL